MTFSQGVTGFTSHLTTKQQISRFYVTKRNKVTNQVIATCTVQCAPVWRINFPLTLIPIDCQLIQCTLVSPATLCGIEICSFRLIGCDCPISSLTLNLTSSAPGTEIQQAAYGSYETGYAGRYSPGYLCSNISLIRGLLIKGCTAKNGEAQFCGCTAVRYIIEVPPASSSP